VADPLSPTRITTMLLCDFAQVREGLLTVVSGGVTRVGLSRFPSPTPLYLAIVLYLPPDATDREHAVRVLFKYPETAEKFAEANVNVSPHVGDEQRVEGISFPVPLDLRGVTLPKAGLIDIQVEVDGELQGELTLHAFETATR
jgi:hypothetical protein